MKSLIESIFFLAFTCRMVELLMDCVCKEDKSGTMALAILENLAGENK